MISARTRVKRRYSWVFVVLLCTFSTQLCVAQAQESPSRVDGQAIKRPDYSLRTTTLSEAIEYWHRRGMNTVQWGHLALGSGHVPADKIVLVDVVGADFEGMSYARFFFYDNKLYRIQAPFRWGPPFRVNEGTYSDNEISTLESDLTHKYGKAALYRSYLSTGGQKKDVMVWNIDGNSLKLLSNPTLGGLVYTNEGMEGDVKRYIKSYCKQFNTHGSICW
jgi:hypothetical protein